MSVVKIVLVGLAVFLGWRWLQSRGSLFDNGYMRPGVAQAGYAFLGPGMTVAFDPQAFGQRYRWGSVAGF